MGGRVAGGMKVKRGSKANYRFRKGRGFGHWPKAAVAMVFATGLMAAGSFSTSQAVPPGPFSSTIRHNQISTQESRAKAPASLRANRIAGQPLQRHGGHFGAPDRCGLGSHLQRRQPDAAAKRIEAVGGDGRAGCGRPGRLTLLDTVTLKPEDLTLFHQPLAAMVTRNGYTTDLADLMTRAMTESDNTANDAVLRQVGGPDAVRGYLARRFIPNIRFGPGERLLQSATAGLQWNQKLAFGGGFSAARAALPRAVRDKALDDYLANPMDGAAPSSITYALVRLKRGRCSRPPPPPICWR